MLVVMKILMSSDTPGQPPLGQPAPRTAGDGDDAANQRPRRLPEEPGRTTPAKTQLDLARLSEVRAPQLRLPRQMLTWKLRTDALGTPRLS